GPARRAHDGSRLDHGRAGPLPRVRRPEAPAHQGPPTPRTPPVPQPRPLAKVLDAAHDSGSKTLALAQKGAFRERSIGEFQVYICQGCGLVEWYVPDLSGIVADGENVRELEGSAPDPGGPYR